MRRTRSSLLLAVVAVLAASIGTGSAASAAAPAPAPAPASAPNPSDFVSVIDNPYFPLTPGTSNIYTGSKDGKSALVVFEVTNKTKTILGVKCHVIHDRLFLNGYLAEDTLDWYAQDKAGTVWYFGEATKTLDHAGHVISTEGSFQAGVDGARQGIFMPAHPKVGATYQQEFYAGHAEDRFKVLSLTKTVKIPAGTFKNTMLTAEWTPLEPDVRGGKSYARGIGNIREFDLKGGDEHLELVAVIRAGDGEDR